MAAQGQDVQYYDWRFVTNEGNLVYQNIINCDLYKPPYFNDSFRNLFAQSPFDKWDKTQFFVNKRAWFTKIALVWPQSDTSDWDNPHVTDMRVIDWFRYFFVLNDVKTKMRIYKQVHVNDLSPCDNSCLNAVTEGVIENITSYKWKTYFPFKSCLYDRFVVTTHVKWKKKCTWTTGIARVNLVGDTYFSSLTNEDWSDINAVAWDYIYIQDWKWITWYVAKVWGIAADLPTWWMVIAPNAIMINGIWVPWINMSAADGTPLTDKSEDKIWYTVYKDYWLTLNRVTSDGIMHWNYDNNTSGTFEYNYAGDTYFNTNDNAVSNPKQIYCICSWGDSFSYLDWKTGILWNWWIGRNKFSFSPAMNVVTNWLYTRIQEYMWYLILVWPDNMWYFTRDQQTGATNLGNITDSNGYWSQASFNTSDENFFFIRKSKDFYQMWLQSSYSYSIPVWYFTYMSNFLNTDLGMLIRGIDEVTLDTEDNKFHVFINNGWWNTKLLIFDRYYNLWHKRYIQWCDMTRLCDGVYLWRWVFANIGNTDNWNPITQIVTMVWWDQWHTANKKIEFVKLPIWFNSYVESHLTWFSSTVTDGWWKYETVYWDLGRTDYITNLMRSKLGPDLDNQALAEIANYQVWLEIDNCLGTRAWIEIFDTYNEFNSYIDYWLDSSISSTWDEETEFCLAKMGVIKIPLGQWWEVFTFEIVARWTNKVEFGWFFIGYQYSDIDITRLENTATLWDLTTDSGYTPEVNINNPDQLLGVTP